MLGQAIWEYTLVHEALLDWLHPTDPEISASNHRLNFVSWQANQLPC